MCWWVGCSNRKACKGANIHKSKLITKPHHAHISNKFMLYNICMLQKSWHTRQMQLTNCWLGVRESIWPAKIEWWGVGVVICLERGADCLHMVQLMPLHSKPPSSLASFKSRLVLPFWYRLSQVVLEKRLLMMSILLTARLLCVTCYINHATE